MASYEINVVLSQSDEPNVNPDKSKKSTDTKPKASSGIGSGKEKLTNKKAMADSKLGSKLGGPKTMALGALGIGLTAANTVSNYMVSGASIRGADYKAERLSNTMGKVNKGAMIVGAFAVAGPVGGVLALASVGYQLAQENRKFIKDMQVDRVQAAYYAQRLTQNISERR